MEKNEIVKSISPLLDRALSDVQKKDIMENKVAVNRAIALFTQEIFNCSAAGSIVLNSALYGELLMKSLESADYVMFSSMVRLLQWHMLEQSPHTDFLWAMTVLLERIYDLKLFKSTLDMKVVNKTLAEINHPNHACCCCEDDDDEEPAPETPKKKAPCKSKCGTRCGTKTAAKKNTKRK